MFVCTYCVLHILQYPSQMHLCYTSGAFAEKELLRAGALASFAPLDNRSMMRRGGTFNMQCICATRVTELLLVSNMTVLVCD